MIRSPAVTPTGAAGVIDVALVAVDVMVASTREIATGGLPLPGRRHDQVRQAGLLPAGLDHLEVVPRQLSLEVVRGQVRADVVARLRQLNLRDRPGVVPQV